MSITEAAVEATRRRFRPIVMTSFAFILGVVPLLVAGGAGAASQQAIGTVVFGGMLSSTLLAIPFVPVFFVDLATVERKAQTTKRFLGARMREDCCTTGKTLEHLVAVADRFQHRGRVTGHPGIWKWQCP